MLNNSGVNKVLLVGHIGKQPRRHTFNETQMLCFPLVTREFIKKNGEKIEHLEQHQIKIPVSCIGDCNELKRGDMLYVQGKIQTQQYVDEQNIKRYKTEVIVNSIQLLGVETPAWQAIAV